MVEWKGRWTCNLAIPGSSLSTPSFTYRLRCVNSQLVYAFCQLAFSSSFCLFEIFVSLFGILYSHRKSTI